MKRSLLIYILLFIMEFSFHQAFCQENKRDTTLFNEHQVNFEHMDFISHIRELKVFRKYKGDTSRITICADPYWISNLVTNEEYSIYLNIIKVDSLEGVYQNALPALDLLNQKIKELDITLSEYSSKQEYKYYPVLGLSWYQARKYCAWKTITVYAELEMAQLPNEKIYRLPIQAEIEFAKKIVDINLPVISKIDSTYNNRDIVDFNKSINEWTGEAFLESTYFTKMSSEKDSDKIVIYRKKLNANTFGEKEKGFLNVGFRFAQTYRTVKNSE
ncbi:MAG: SUMF1/EgtB/PvdO family nonheme iron enzyme [Bacteroidales bacterium]|nr:SUMF1/EgtB/PvdO family nonheme iron enzyme [Bacteroidales bacterium]